MAEKDQSGHFDDPIPLTADEVANFQAASQDTEAIPTPEPPPVVEDEPISLVSDDEMEDTVISSDASETASAVRAIKSSLEKDRRTEFKRTPVNVGTGAIRCRMFHCKIAESSMEHMQNQINAWLDDNDVDVKHVGHMVGMMEGKHTEPNIVVMVWY